MGGKITGVRQFFWALAVAVLAASQIMVLGQVPEFANYWIAFAALARAAGWTVQATPVSSTPLAAASFER